MNEWGFTDYDNWWECTFCKNKYPKQSPQQNTDDALRESDRKNNIDRMIVSIDTAIQQSLDIHLDMWNSDSYEERKLAKSALNRIHELILIKEKLISELNNTTTEEILRTY